MADRANLTIPVTCVLDSSGNGIASAGPADSAGPANWEVTNLFWTVTNIGVAPIPRIVIYQDIPTNIQCLDYDGSFGSGSGSLKVSRGSKLYAQWTGGTPGDTATFVITGEKW